MTGVEARFAGFCIITQDVERLKGFYQITLKADSEGSEIHSIIHLSDSSFAIYNPSKHQNARMDAMDSGAGSIILEFEVSV